jgi:WD40 repeat protein
LARIWTVAGASAGAVLDAESRCVSRFSADGNRVVTLSGGGDDVRVRDALSGKQLGVVRSAYLTVNDVALSPDGAFLVTGEQNGTARVWEVTTGRELAVFRGQRGPVTAVSFSPDGRRVAAGSEDGISLVYDCRACAAADELLEAARVGVVRSDRPRNAAATG